MLWDRVITSLKFWSQRLDDKTKMRWWTRVVMWGVARLCCLTRDRPVIEGDQHTVGGRTDRAESHVEPRTAQGLHTGGNVIAGPGCHQYLQVAFASFLGINYRVRLSLVISTQLEVTSSSPWSPVSACLAACKLLLLGILSIFFSWGKILL